VDAFLVPRIRNVGEGLLVDDMGGSGGFVACRCEGIGTVSKTLNGTAVSPPPRPPAAPSASPEGGPPPSPRHFGFAGALAFFASATPLRIHPDPLNLTGALSPLDPTPVSVVAGVVFGTPPFFIEQRCLFSSSNDASNQRSDTHDGLQDSFGGALLSSCHKLQVDLMGTCTDTDFSKMKARREVSSMTSHWPAQPYMTNLENLHAHCFAKSGCVCCMPTHANSCCCKHLRACFWRGAFVLQTPVSPGSYSCILCLCDRTAKWTMVA